MESFFIQRCGIKDRRLISSGEQQLPKYPEVGLTRKEVPVQREEQSLLQGMFHFASETL